MKTTEVRPEWRTLVIIAIAALSGCVTEKTSQFIPIDGGFGYVTHAKGFTDRSLSAGLCYKNTNGVVTSVWPYLGIGIGGNLIVKKNMGVLVGKKAVLFDNGQERLTSRLFAFEAPSGPPLDITDEVLGKYYFDSGMTLTNFVWDSIGNLVTTNGALRFTFASAKLRPGTTNVWDSFGCTLTMPWSDVETIIGDVRTSGTRKKEKRSGFDYVQK